LAKEIARKSVVSSSSFCPLTDFWRDDRPLANPQKLIGIRFLIYPQFPKIRP